MTATEIVRYFIDNVSSIEARKFFMTGMKHLNIRDRMCDISVMRPMIQSPWYRPTEGVKVSLSEGDSIGEILTNSEECLYYLFSMIDYEDSDECRDKAVMEWKTFLKKRVRKGIYKVKVKSVDRVYGYYGYKRGFTTADIVYEIDPKEEKKKKKKEQ